MAKTRAQNASPGLETGATAQRWPKVVAAPAVWESGSAALRLGEAPRTLYRPRNRPLGATPRRLSW